MPQYLFENIETGEIHDVFYHMNDVKDYRGADGKATTGTWRRVWTKPQAAIDTTVDPYKASDFVKVTNKNGTLGDMWDRSAELSAKRAAKEGKDPVKERFYTNYAKKRKGHKHPQQRREEAAADLKKKGITIDWGDSC